MERTLQAIEEILGVEREAIQLIEDQVGGYVTADCGAFEKVTKARGRIEGLEKARKMLEAERAEAPVADPDADLREEILLADAIEALQQIVKGSTPGPGRAESRLGRQKIHHANRVILMAERLAEIHAQEAADAGTVEWHPAKRGDLNDLEKRSTCGRYRIYAPDRRVPDLIVSKRKDVADWVILATQVRNVAEAIELANEDRNGVTS